MTGMTRSMGTIPDLSARVATLIEKTFSAAEAPRIREMIREFHWAPEPLLDERIHLDVLEICEGKIEKTRELVELAKVDWRDLIVVAEYDVKDGKLSLNARGYTRLAEIAIKKRNRVGNE